MSTWTASSPLPRAGSNASSSTGEKIAVTVAIPIDSVTIAIAAKTAYEAQVTP
jgi:hypothetical protein